MFTFLAKNDIFENLPYILMLSILKIYFIIFLLTCLLVYLVFHSKK